MWIFTTKGFFTFVTDRKDPDYLWLRARMQEHIEDNFPGVKAEMKPGADYLWRAKVKRDDVALRIAELVLESRVDSHFKDVMIRTAAAPKRGSLSKVMYAVWNGAAEWQDYAPYSKTPRPAPQPVKPQTWKNGSADRQPGTGQSSLLPYTYGGAASGGARGSEFDWDSRSWGGTSTPDPKLPAMPMPEVVGDDEWARMSAEEQEAYLDAEEAWFQGVEAQGDYQAALRALEVETVRPAPRNRPGTRKNRRGKGKRQNRHNQSEADRARYEQERREGKHGSEARNRQAYLDKKAGAL